MLAKTKVAKLEQQLGEANARVRNLTIEECLSAIAIAEQAVKELLPELRQAVCFKYSPHEVGASYTKGTSLVAKFNKAGKCIDTVVERTTVSSCGKSRLVFTSWYVARDAIQKINNGHVVSERMIKVVLRSNGFNTLHLVKTL